MTEINEEFEIVDVRAEDAAEDAMCKQILYKADYIDGLIDKFLDENPAKALAFVTALESAALDFIADEFGRSLEEDQ